MTQVSFTGRLMQGDAHKPQPQSKDDKGNLKFRKNGDPDCPFLAVVGVPKDPAARFAIQGLPSYEQEKGRLDDAARTAWPQFFGQRPQGLSFAASLAPDCKNPKFSNKLFDGDGYDDKGQPYAAKHPEWAGHWIVKFTSYFAPQAQEWREDQADGRGAPLPGNWFDCSRTGRTIKCGDFVTITGSCDTNNSADRPGMYMNLTHVAFEKEGELIVSSGGSSIDARAVIGARGGASNPPAANAHVAQNSAPAHTAQTSQTASDPQAYSGYREAAPPPPPVTSAPPPPPAAAGPVMTALAGSATYQNFLDGGWTHEQMVQNGYVVA